MSRPVKLGGLARAVTVASAFRLWQLWLAEAVGTALLVAVGGSLVIVDFAPASPISQWLPAEVRRALTGGLFGSVGALIALSPVGKVSGAHINPVVTLAFWVRRRLPGMVALGYVAAQLLGAVAGAEMLRSWGAWGMSVHWAATVPGPGGRWPALAGEAAATAALVAGLFGMLGSRPLRRWVPALFPLLYAWLVWWEAPLSGTSTNPARSFGPAVVGSYWPGWWIYWVGPLAGAAAALVALAQIKNLEVEVAKVYHFHHDPAHRFEQFARRAQARHRRSSPGG